MTTSVTIDTLLASVRANLATKLTQREAETKKINEVREACHAAADRDPTNAESEVSRAAVEARTAIDAEIDQLKAQIAEFEAEKRADEAAAALSRDVQATQTRKPAYDEVINRGNTNEARTYTRETNSRGTSFFSDSFHYHFRSGGSDVMGRIERHDREVQVHGEMTQRALNTGAFGGLIVPQYLIDLAAPVLRAGRPFANSIGPSLPLPETGMTFDIPRGTTGASVAVQATENSSVSATDEVWTDLTLRVATAAGQSDVSRQSLERGGINDSLIFLDLAGAYSVNLDQQLLSGSGSSGQVLGVLNTAGIAQGSAFTAAATPQTFYTKLAGAQNSVETTRFMPPTAQVMAPRRWNWMLTQFDTTNRPLVVPNAQGPFNSMGTTEGTIDIGSVSPVGGMLGLPTIIDANIPQAVGTASEDVAIVYRREDLLLWEDGDGSPRELRFEQTLGNQLTVKLVSYGYFAFTAGRYPQAVAVVGGNAGTVGFGMIAPTF